jgi:hypothetical protein
MNWRVVTVGLLLVVLLVVPLAGTAGAQPGQDEVNAAIANGVEWLAKQQDETGFWGHWEQCAVTALAVKKLEHHAVDPKYGLGLPSPFYETYAYKGNVEKGLKWLFENCVFTTDIDLQEVEYDRDPDTDGDEIGIYWSSPVHHRSYSTGIGLMTICEAVDLDREITSGPLTGWTYEEVARDTMDYLAWAQMDPNNGNSRGGWGYAGSDDGVLEQGWDRSDNSNAGWVTLGLGFAEAPWPGGCGFEVPGFVKDELGIWIDYIQNDLGAADNQWCDYSGDEWGDCDGGSGYETPDMWGWVNILKTGNLLQQMALVGDTLETGRVTDALDYLERHWNDPNWDPGWKGHAGWPASYHATFTAMKGLTSFGLYDEFGEEPIYWQADFEEALLADQVTDPDDPMYGSWPWCDWGDDVLCTTWALLTLQKAAPRPPVEGRMTGGGSVFGSRVTHGFELYCDAGKGPNNLEVNWGKGNKFHLENLTVGWCWDDLSIDERPPVAGFDTYVGSGTGRYNGVSGANIRFEFTDAGEPGKNDLVMIRITDVGGNEVLDVSGNLKNGNHQAHRAK